MPSEGSPNPPEKPEDIGPSASSELSEAAANAHEPNEIDDDVLGVIAEVETQLADLKRVHAERAKAASDLDDRERRVIEREHELVFQFEQLKGEHTAISEARQALAKDREAIAENTQKIQETQDAIAAREAELATTEASLTQQRSDLEIESQALSQERERFDADKKTASEAEATITKLEAELSNARDEVNAANESLEAIKGELDQAQAAAEARGADLESQAQELAEAKKAVEAAHAEAEQTASQANAQINELRTQLDSRLSEVETLKADLEAKSAEIDNERDARAEAERSIHDLTKKHDDTDAANKKQISELTNKLDVAKDKIREFAEALKQQMDSGIGPDPALKQSLEKERATTQKLREQINELRLKVKNNTGEADPAVAEALERERAEAESLRTRIAELETAISNAATAEPQGNTDNQAESDELSAALAEERAINQALREKLAEVDTSSDQVPAGVAEELAAARTRIQELESIAKSAAGPVSDAATEIRRDRLRRIRHRLRDQSRKVRRASEVLHERHQQCEQLLTKRAELAAAHQAIMQERSKVNKKRARLSAVWTIAGVFVVLGIMAGLSWVISDLVSPGAYAATAVIAADAGERPLGDEDLNTWQVYHEDLIADPRFLQTLAERMQRRGIGDLATPAALSELLETSLTTDSPADGVLTLELRGEGATRTQRVLDTVVVTLASTANKSRARRSDGAMSDVREKSVASADSLDMTRMYTAGGIFGGSVFFGLIAGGIVWGRLSGVKTSYERDQQLEVLLDEARWVDPRDPNAPV